MKHFNSSIRSSQKQQGVILIITIIVLVAMTLAAIALVRSVDVTTQISGNLAFRQAGVQAADNGIEVARQWLVTTSSANSSNLFNNSGASYFATWNGGVTAGTFDPATFDWAANSTMLSEDAAGNVIQYVIHRMCESTGDPGDPTKNCFTAPTSASGNSNRVKEGGEFGCTGNNCTASSNPYYRITTMVTGPRNTVTYVQAVIY